MQQTVFSYLPGLMAAGRRSPFKTYAPSPVWNDSARGEVRFHPLPKREVFALYRKLKAWNRQKAKGRYGGSIGSACLRVFECLAFDFLNFKSGRLDPSYNAIAAKTGLGRSTVAEALKRLKALGVINWVRRCSPVPGGSPSSRHGIRMEQDSNAYGLCPASCWLGYIEPPTFVMQPHEWGAVPPLLSCHEQAIQDGKRGASVTDMVRTLKLDPDNEIAAALARLGENVARRSASQNTGVQNTD